MLSMTNPDVVAGGLLVADTVVDNESLAVASVSVSGVDSTEH